jgi:hypothetical protein
VDTWSVHPWADGPPLDEADLPLALDAAAAHMRGLARTFVGLPAWIRTLELTGGRDSRLVLSLLLAEGLAEDLVCVTWGDETLPDVVVASAIADRFGLDLRAAGRERRAAVARRDHARPQAPPVDAGRAAPPPEAGAVTFEERLRHHVWLSSGASSVWDLSPTIRRPSPSLALSGLLGELLRSNLSRTGTLRSFDDLLAYHRAGELRYDRARVLRPDVSRHYAALVERRLEELRSGSDDPRDVADGYFQRERQRRWFGPAHENDTRNRLFPLYSLPAMRVAFGAGASRRRAELVPFGVMRSCCDDLARMRFAGKQWAAAAVAGAPHADAYPVEPEPTPWRPPRWQGRVRERLRRARPPAVARRSSPSGVGEAARMQGLESKVPVLRELVDLGAGHPFHDLVDRRALERAITDLPSLDFQGRRAVHDAVTAAIWLAGGEAPVAPITDA